MIERRNDATDDSRPSSLITWVQARQSIVEVAAVLLAPLLLFFTLAPQHYFLQNGLDPQIYLGFASRPDDLFERFGNSSYYGVRFGLIWPIELTTRMFGVTPGYYVLRWGLATISSGALYWSLRRLAGRPVAAAAALSFLTSAVTVRALMTAYTDTTSVPYVACALGLLLATSTSRHRRTIVFTAGVLLALAIHSNPFNVAVTGVLVGCWVIRESPRTLRRITEDLLTTAAAIGVVTLVGVLVYEARFGYGDIFSPSIDAVRSISSDGGASFRSPTYDWLWMHLHLYVPVVALSAFAVANIRGSRPPARWEVTSALMLAAMLAFLLVHQFLLRSTTLETYYYASSLSPFESVVIAAVLASVWRQRATAMSAQLAVVVAIPAVPLLLDAVPWAVEVRFPGALVLLCAVLAAAWFLVSPSPGRRLASTTRYGTTVVALAFAVCVGLLLHAPPRDEAHGSLFHPHYEEALGVRDTTGMDVYRATFELLDVVPPLQTDDGIILIWNNKADPYASTITGAFLGLASTFQSDGTGMPYVDTWLTSRIPYEHVREIVLLSTSEERVDAGEQALRSAGVAIRSTHEHTIGSGQLQYRVRVVILDWPE